MTLSAAQRATHALQRFARGRAAAVAQSVPARETLEQCELCAAPVSSAHEHLLEAKSRAIRCACAACALLFDDNATAGALRYRRLNGQARRLTYTALSERDLVALNIPVRLCFLCPSAAHEALFLIYPSAAGPIEAQSSWRAWRELVAQHAELAAVEPDRDAVVVDLRGGAARSPLHVTLDIAYELLGLLRSAEAEARFAGFEARLDALCGRRGQRA
jgi:hypothetical protein